MRIGFLAKVFLLLCLVQLTSCNVSMSKKDKEENMMQTPTLSESEKQALSSAFFEQGEWPSKNWWEKYECNELNKLVEKALKNNPSIEAVFQKVEIAKNEAIIRRSKLFPLVYFNGEDFWQYLSKDGLYRQLNPRIGLNNRTVKFSLSFNYEIDFWYKYRNLYRQAVSETKAAIAEAAQVELMTATAVAQAYFGVRVNMMRKKIFEELYLARKDYFDLQQSLLKHSIDAAQEPLLSQEMVYEAEQLIYDVDKEIENGIHLVNMLTGDGPDATISLTEELKKLPPKLAIPEGISLEFLSRRPDLMAQLFRMEALAYAVGAAKADFYPNFDIGALLGFESGKWSNIFTWASKTAGLLPAFKMPVYTAGAIGANVKGKKAMYNDAVFQYNDLILKGLQEVADLLVTGKAIYQEQCAQEKIVSNSLKRLKLASLKKDKGIDGLMPVYLKIEELMERKLKKAELLYEQYAVSIQLVRSLGGGYVYETGGKDDAS